MGGPSDRKELGTDPKVLHSGPARCAYIWLHSDFVRLGAKWQYLGTQSTFKAPVLSVIDIKIYI